MNRALTTANPSPIQASGKPVGGSCVAAIHGASTRSSLVLASPAGEIYGVWRDDKGMNWRESGRDNALTVLEGFYQHLTHDDQTLAPARYSCRRVVLAVAGLFCGLDERQMRDVISGTRWDDIEWSLITDAWATLVAGAMQDFGIAVMAGSTASVYGRTTSGQHCLVGGGGSLIGNEGGGVYIAKEALNAVLRARDGRSSLQDHTLEQCIQAQLRGRNLEEILAWISDVRERGALLQLARIAPAVTDAAETHQNPVARAILHKAAQELLACFDAARQRLEFKEDQIPVVLEGGVIENCLIISEVLANEIPRHEPRAVVSFPRYRPVIGALLLALADGAHLPEKRVVEQLLRSVQALPADQAAWVLGPRGSRGNSHV